MNRSYGCPGLPYSTTSVLQPASTPASISRKGYATRTVKLWAESIPAMQEGAKRGGCPCLGYDIYRQFHHEPLDLSKEDPSHNVVGMFRSPAARVISAFHDDLHTPMAQLDQHMHQARQDMLQAMNTAHDRAKQLRIFAEWPYAAHVQFKMLLGRYILIPISCLLLYYSI